MDRCRALRARRIRSVPKILPKESHAQPMRTRGHDLGARILIAGGDTEEVGRVQAALAGAGYTAIRRAARASDVLALIDETRPDLMVLDLAETALAGAILEALSGPGVGDDDLPVLVLAGDAERDARLRALAAGADDFVARPLDPAELVVRAGNLVRARAARLELRRQGQALDDRVRERTERLLQVEKLSAMGQLLAGVAHELNNPLSVLRGESVMLYLAPAVSTAPRAERIMRASERCVQLVRNFLKLAGHWPARRTCVDLNAAIHEVLDLLAYELRSESIEVRLDLADPLPPMGGDPEQLHQVFVNLIVNAVHAMREAPGPRALTVQTRVAADPARVVATVRDTGPGVPVDIQARIFDPFFTTKPPGQGTGLGLSLSAGVIRDHGGAIRLESEPGHGAVFVVELPVSHGGGREPHRVPCASARTSDERIMGKRVLVVDDEGDVAAVLADVLRLDGHHVDTAGNGATALEALAAGGYDVVLSDTRMPVLDGPGFYRALARRHPQLAARVAFITGDTLNMDRRGFLESTGQPIIAKPFEPDEVRDVVQRLLRA